MLDLARLGEVPLLVAPRAVAGVEADRPPSSEVTQRVQALGALSQGTSGHPTLTIRDLQVGVDIVQIPLERLALQILSELQPLLDGTEGYIFSERDRSVVIFLVFIHPHLSSSPSVPGEHSSAPAGETVGMLLPKYMADSAARH